MTELPFKPCPKARNRGGKARRQRRPTPVPHEPHSWFSGNEHIGDNVIECWCEGYP